MTVWRSARWSAPAGARAIRFSELARGANAIRDNRGGAQLAPAGPAGVARPPPRRNHRARSADCRPASSPGRPPGDRPLPAAGTARGSAERAQRYRDCVPRMAVDVPRNRPRRTAPSRRNRVRHWRRGDGCERDLREGAGLRRYRWLCRSDARRGGREGVASDDYGRRQPLSWHPVDHRLASRPSGLGVDGHPARRPAHGKRVREGLARLAPLGLSFDAWMYHTQLGELVDLARAFPETPIVLDHVGGAIGLGPYAGK